MNGNIFNGQQNANGFYNYGYPAAMPTMARPEAPAYMMPQAPAPAFIKGRPVSSFEEARVAQVDLDGSTFIFPDLGNKKIYTKRINADGTATLHSYSLEGPIEEPSATYATKEDVAALRAALDEVVSRLKTPVATTPQAPVKTNF